MTTAWLLVGGAVLAGAAYMQGRSDGRDACQAAEARDQHVATVAANAAASAAAGQIARIKVQHTTIRQEVEREIQQNVVYRECSHDAGQLQRINAALTGAEPIGPAARGELPAADADGRRELRGDDPEADRSGRPVP